VSRATLPPGIPFQWSICDHCQGHGTTTRHVECDGGGFTASEWAEQDEDFREDYMAGRYDRPCPHCQNGKVQIPDVARCSFAQRRELVELRRAAREREMWAAQERAELRAFGYQR